MSRLSSAPPAAVPPHPATVLQRKTAPHPATVHRERPPHPAAVAQRIELPPHAAEAAQPRTALGPWPATPPHPATLPRGAVVQRAMAVVQRSEVGSPKADTIGIEYDDEGNEHKVTQQADVSTAFTKMVRDYGLPRTGRVLRQLTKFAKMGAIFSDWAELCEVLSTRDRDEIGAITVWEQARPVFELRKKSKDANFINALVVVDLSGAPVHLTSSYGSKRVGNSPYVFAETNSKKLSRDLDQSQNDSEIGLLGELHEYLITGELCGNIVKFKAAVYVRIVSNMGPCDGCKLRIAKFKKLYAEATKGLPLTIDVYYSSEPGKAKNRDCSWYGWSGDVMVRSGLKNGMYRHKDA